MESEQITDIEEIYKILRKGFRYILGAKYTYFDDDELHFNEVDVFDKDIFTCKNFCVFNVAVTCCSHASYLVEHLFGNVGTDPINFRRFKNNYKKKDLVLRCSLKGHVFSVISIGGELYKIESSFLQYGLIIAKYTIEELRKDVKKDNIECYWGYLMTDREYVLDSMNELKEYNRRFKKEYKGIEFADKGFYNLLMDFWGSQIQEVYKPRIYRKCVCSKEHLGEDD